MEMRVIIIGHGYFGSVYREHVQREPRYKLVGVVDTNYDRLRNLKGATVGESYDTLADSVEHDCVIVCTPPHLHAQLSINALMRGKHVLCMKPGALSMTEAADIQTAASMTDAIFKVDYTLLNAPELIYAQEMRMIHGTISSLSFSRHVVSAPKPEGALFDLLSHDVALCLLLSSIGRMCVTCNEVGVSVTANIHDDEGRQHAFFAASYNATYADKKMLMRVKPDSDITNPRVDILWNQTQRFVETGSQGRSIQTHFKHDPDPITMALRRFYTDCEFHHSSSYSFNNVMRVLHAMKHSSENQGMIVEVGA